MSIYVIEIEAYHEGVFIVVKATSIDEALEKARQQASTYVNLLEESSTFVFPDSLSYRITELSHLGKDNNGDVVARWDK